MSYTGRVSGTSERPSCWGNVQAYEPDTDECEDCRFQHTCRAEVLRQGGGHSTREGYVTPVRVVSNPPPPQPRYPTSSPVPMYRRQEAGYTSFQGCDWEPGLTHPGESALSRFFKDLVSGALRGGSEESVRYFKKHRIK